MLCEYDKKILYQECRFRFLMYSETSEENSCKVKEILITLKKHSTCHVVSRLLGPTFRKHMKQLKYGGNCSISEWF